MAQVKPAWVATKSVAILLEFVQQSLNGVDQSGQCVLRNVPHRAHFHRGVAMNELIADCHDLGQVRDARGSRCINGFAVAVDAGQHIGVAHRAWLY